MIRKLKLTALALLLAAPALKAPATTNLLQAVNVAFDNYVQGQPSGNNNVVNQFFFGSRELIKQVSASGAFNNGDILVRATPVTNSAVLMTNLAVLSTTNLVLTNISTSLEAISSVVLYGGASNYIGGTPLTFGTDIVNYDGTNVTAGTNVATSGTNTFIIGTNTTVVATVLTNQIGEDVGTNYAFAINAIYTVPGTTNTLGAASWAIFNKNTNPQLTPLNTNVLFNIYTARVHDDGTNLAYVHGEVTGANHVIRYGTTDEIRVMVLSNSIWNIRLTGYAHGHVVPISLGGSDVVYSHNYNWFGNGSGTTTNITADVITGDISEDYFKFLK